MTNTLIITLALSASMAAAQIFPSEKPTTGTERRGGSRRSGSLKDTRTTEAGGTREGAKSVTGGGTVESRGPATAGGTREGSRSATAGGTAEGTQSRTAGAAVEGSAPTRGNQTRSAGGAAGSPQTTCAQLRNRQGSNPLWIGDRYNPKTAITVGNHSYLPLCLANASVDGAMPSILYALKAFEDANPHLEVLATEIVASEIVFAQMTEKNVSGIKVDHRVRPR